MIACQMLVANIGQLIPCAGSLRPKRGSDLNDLVQLQDAAIAIDDGKIVAIGDSAEMLARFTTDTLIDAEQKAVIPGFVDSHTHVVYGGNRVDEFEMRLAGASYMEIMAAGGGIVSTMQQTRAATIDELVNTARDRLDQMLKLGTTTVEIKSGYGLDVETELAMLQAIDRLAQSHPCSIVPTFLGAHTVPPAYKDNTEGYVSMLIDEMIPAVAAWYQTSHFSAEAITLSIDVFCEDHAFDVDQSRRILQAGIAAGMTAKMHVDQFNALGGLEVAIELGAISADHLEVTTAAGVTALAASDTIATFVPMANFNLGIFSYPPARQLVDAGAAIALATDMNPGSAPVFSIPLTMAVACRNMRLLPAEALQAATINAAHAIQMADQVGSLEVGKSADILILSSDDYRNMTYLLGNNQVDTVIKAGEVVV